MLVISALSSVDDRIRGLKAGGDDYLVKPFELRELTARVEALSRRSPTRARHGCAPARSKWTSSIARCGAASDASTCCRANSSCSNISCAGPNQIVTRAMLLEDVWNYKFLPQTNVVDVHIGNLRRKIDAGGEPRLIVNVRAAGFKLNVDE